MVEHENCGATELNMNYNLLFSNAEMKAFKSMPVPKDSAWEALEHDWFEHEATVTVTT